MTEFELKLCEKMQRSFGHCDHADCNQCHHMLKLLTVFAKEMLLLNENDHRMR